VVTVDILDMDAARLQAEVLKLRRRVRMLGANVIQYNALSGWAGY